MPRPAPCARRPLAALAAAALATLLAPGCERTDPSPAPSPAGPRFAGVLPCRMTPRQLIDRLKLAPHPEGGHFREVFRAPAAVRPADGRDDRSAMTTIYYLLARGDHSRWHRVASDERNNFV